MNNHSETYLKRNRNVIFSSLAAAIILAGITWFGVYQINTLNKQTQSLYRSPFVVSNSSNKLINKSEEIIDLVSDWEIYKTDYIIVHLERDLIQFEEISKPILEQLNALYLGDLKEINVLISSNDEVIQFSKKLSKAQNKGVFLDLNKKDFIATLNNYKKELLVIENFAQNKAAELSVKATSIRNEAKTQLQISLFLGLILIGFVAYIVIKKNKKDVDEIVTYQKNLEKSETLFRSLFENSPIGISMTEIGGKVQFNNTFCKILGYTKEEVDRKNWKDLTFEEDISKSDVYVKKMLAGELDDAFFDKRYYHKNGAVIWTSIATHLIRNEENKPKLFITFVSDITEKIKAQSILNNLNTKLQDSNQELQDFAYVASHDLQEPLRMISSFIQLLEKKLSQHFDEDAKKYMHFVLDGASRLQIMINDLLKYSRINTTEHEKEKVDLNQIMSNVLDILDQKIIAKKAEITTQKLPEVLGINSLLQTVITNLIENALKYNDEAVPTIKISHQKIDGFFEFAFEDNGIGIDEPYREKIFIIFKRLHQKSEYSGTGIGLSVCSRIIKKHGGKIWVEGASQKGSIFKFTLPK